MKRLLDILARDRTLAWLLAATIAIFCAFQLFGLYLEGPALDLLTSGAQARERLNTMTDAQRLAHAISTLTLDSLFPLVYTALLLGAVRARTSSRWALIPALVTMFADFAENCIQASALLAGPDMLDAKAVLTPLKFGGFFLAAALAIGLWILKRSPKQIS